MFKKFLYILTILLIFQQIKVSQQISTAQKFINSQVPNNVNHFLKQTTSNPSIKTFFTRSTLFTLRLNVNQFNSLSARTRLLINKSQFSQRALVPKNICLPRRAARHIFSHPEEVKQTDKRHSCVGNTKPSVRPPPLSSSRSRVSHA